MKENRNGVLGFSLPPLWCYPLHLHHCLNECEASWLWDFCFSPRLLSLSGLIVVSLVTKKKKRVRWNSEKPNNHFKDNVRLHCSLFFSPAAFAAWLTCWGDKRVLSFCTIIAVTGAHRLLLLLVWDHSLSRALKHGLDDNRILVDLQCWTDTHTHTQSIDLYPLTSENGGNEVLLLSNPRELHLRALQVIGLSIVAQEVNIFLQIPHASVLVVAYTFLPNTGSAAWTRCDGCTVKALYSALFIV